MVAPAAPNLLFPSKAGADAANGVGAADRKPKELGPVVAQTKPPVANAGAALVVAANAPPSLSNEVDPNPEKADYEIGTCS